MKLGDAGLRSNSDLSLRLVLHHRTVVANACGDAFGYLRACSLYNSSGVFRKIGGRRRPDKDALYYPKGGRSLA